MSAGYTPGIGRLGIPALQSSDASMGAPTAPRAPAVQHRHGIEERRGVGRLSKSSGTELAASSID
jgi:hypothetical protein